MRHPQRRNLRVRARAGRGVSRLHGEDGGSFRGYSQRVEMFQLDEVVPWGRSLDEYRRMFALTDADMGGRILGCADGPASFNAEATALGCSVVSFDPLYRLGVAEIRDRIDRTFQMVIDQTRKNAAEFIWGDDLPDVETLGQRRMTAMTTFLNDFGTGKASGRYVDAELPTLPFADDSFDVAVCSHFLFLYSEQLLWLPGLSAQQRRMRYNRSIESGRDIDGA